MNVLIIKSSLKPLAVSIYDKTHASSSTYLYLSIYIFFRYTKTRRRIHRYDIFSALLWPVWNHIPKVLYICLYVRVRERVPCTEPPVLFTLHSHSILSSSTIFAALLIIQYEIDRWYNERSTVFSIYTVLSFFLSFYFYFTCPSEWSLRECVTPSTSLELYAYDHLLKE